jgi:hypothetical protein
LGRIKFEKYETIRICNRIQNKIKEGKLQAVKFIYDSICPELKKDLPNRIGLKESKELADDFSDNPKYIWKKINNKI